MDIKDIADLTAKAFGVLGFLLASYSLYLQRRDKRPQLRLADPKVSVQQVVPVDDMGGGTRYEDGPAISVRVQNTGEKEIRLASAHLLTWRYFFWRRRTEIKYADVYASMGTVAIGSGRDLTFHIPDPTPLKQSHGYLELEDEISNKYRSRWFRLRFEKK